MEEFIKTTESVIFYVAIYGSLIGVLVLIFTKKPAPQKTDEAVSDVVTPAAVPSLNQQSGLVPSFARPPTEKELKDMLDDDISDFHAIDHTSADPAKNPFDLLGLWDTEHCEHHQSFLDKD